MSFRTIGLIFLLIAAGFFLSWGTPGGSNLTVDVILGGIFAIIGYSIMTYQNPLAGVTDRFIRVANQVMDDPGVLISAENAKEGIHRIQKEARKATRAIKEGAQNRIDTITQDTQEPALVRADL